ncbi:hypothetical protein [Sphingobium ummariense]
MQEPTPHSSRLALAGGLIALLAVGGGGFFIGRSTAPKPAPVAATAHEPTPAPPPPPTILAPPPTLERAGLLGLVADAADAASRSLPQPEAVQSAAGRRFDLVLPFGCDGPVEGPRTAPFGWQYDAAKTTLRVWINPTRWKRATWALEDSEEDKSALEGFWIATPWSMATECPTRSSGGAVPAADPAQVENEVAIARLIEGEIDKSPRRLEIVKRMEPSDFDPARGFALRITGRTQSVQAGGPVQCVQRGGRQQRPQCVIIGHFSELHVQNPKTGDVLALWPISETSQRD